MIYPKISIITPSFNSGNYLEATLLSVLEQDYPNLEFILVDGGSTDESVAIIEKYADKLSYWISEPDSGMYDAINKGFEKSTGEIMAWLNSDDMYLPWTFAAVADIFSSHPQIEWLTSLFSLWWDEGGQGIRCIHKEGFNSRSFFHGEYLPGSGPYTRYYIQQESTFWRRTLWEKAGGRVNSDMKLAGDFDLWARFFSHSELTGVETPLAGFRLRPGQITDTLYDEYVKEALSVFDKYGIRPHSNFNAWILNTVFKKIPKTLKRILRKSGLIARYASVYNMGRGEGWQVKSVL